jgi:hypothetical protein
MKNDRLEARADNLQDERKGGKKQRRERNGRTKVIENERKTETIKGTNNYK